MTEDKRGPMERAFAASSQGMIEGFLFEIYKKMNEAQGKQNQRISQMKAEFEEKLKKQEEEFQVKLNAEREKVRKEEEEKYKVKLNELKLKARILETEKAEFLTEKAKFQAQAQFQIKHFVEWEDRSRIEVRELNKHDKKRREKLAEMEKRMEEKAKEFRAREKEVVLREQDLFLEKVHFQEMVRENTEKMKVKEEELDQRQKVLEKKEGVQTELSRKMKRGIWIDIQDFCQFASEVGTPQEQELSMKVDKFAKVLTRRDVTKKVVIKFDNEIRASFGVQSLSGVKTGLSATGQDLRVSLKNVCQEMLSVIRGGDGTLLRKHDGEEAERVRHWLDDVNKAS